MKSAWLLLALALIGFVAAQPYVIELPEVYSSTVNITIEGANTMLLLGNYYADQSNLVARLDATGIHVIDNGNNVSTFAHSTVIDVLRNIGYEIVLNDGVFECIQQTYANPFDVSQLYYEQFIETTYYNNHLVDYVANKSDSNGNVITAWVDRFLQIPVGFKQTDGLSYTLAEYSNLLTSVPENVFNFDRLPTQCQNNTGERLLSKMAVESPAMAAYQAFIDRIFPLKK